MKMKPGVYEGEVVWAKLKIFESGTEAIAIRAKVSDGHETRELYGNLFLTEKTIGHARAALKDLQFDFMTRDLTDIDNGALEGKKIKVEIQEESYNGKTELKVTRFGMTPRLEKERIVSIQQRLRQEMKDPEFMAKVEADRKQFKAEESALGKDVIDIPEEPGMTEEEVPF